MKKRVLSVLLALSMCMTLLPASAWAEETDAKTPPATGDAVYTVAADTAVQNAENDVAVQAAEDAVAEVDGTTYTNLITAFDAAQEKESATVKLLSNVSTNGESKSGSDPIDGAYTFRKGNVTFDLNGYTLTWTKYDVYGGSLGVGDGGSLTIQDSGTDGKIYYGDGYTFGVYGGTLNIKSGTVESNSNYYALKISGGDVHITDGTLKNGNYSGDGVYISPDTVNSRTATLTISGNAKLIGGENGSGLSVSRVSDENPVVKLSGGTYTGGSGIQCYSTTVGTLLEENYRYMLNGSEITDTSGATLASGVTVEANPNAPVQYVDADGNNASANCTKITADITELTNGSWYAVSENVKTSNAPFVSGEVNLILCDGAEWALEYGLLMGKDATLNIYVQSAGTGKLTAVGMGTKPGIGMDTEKSGGTLNIYGGVITATSHSWTPSSGGEVSVSESRGAAIGTCGGSNAGMTVNIYGGTVTAKATYGAAAIGRGQDASGTVNVTIADGMKCVETENPTVKVKYGNTDGTSVTVTKCNDHQWAYTQNGDTHTATCELCGTSSGAVNHSYTGWKSNGADGHTGTCVCGATCTENHTLTATPNEDGLSHSSKCSVCEYATAAENHSFDENGKCATCQVQMVAKVDDKYYTTLAAAINAAKNGGTVTLLAEYALENITVTDGNVTIDLNGKTWVTAGNGAEPTLIVKGGSVTVKNGSLETGFTSNAATTVVIEGGSMTVGEGMTVKGGGTGIEANPYCPAIEVKGGELTLSTGTKLDYGMHVPENKTLADYLPEGTAFVQIPFDGAGSFVNGYVQELTGAYTLIVTKHTHSFAVDSTCACGAKCPHTNIGDDDKCTTCQAQMVAKVGDKYYTTLAAAIEAAKNGGTVTMLDLGDWWVLKESITIKAGTDVTIDMDITSWEAGDTTSPALTVDGGTVTLKNGALYPVKDSSADSIVLVKSGSLTLGESMQLSDNSRVPSIIVEGGTLTLAEGTRLYGGLKTSVGGATLADYLPEGTAFKRWDNTGNVVTNGYVTDLTDPGSQFSLIVEKHTHSAIYDSNTKQYVCACGYTCSAHEFENGVCKNCGYACPHEHVTETRGEDWHTSAVCNDCNAQMAVKVELNRETTYYAKSVDNLGTENTLSTIFAKKVKDGSTVTLLADGLDAYAFVDGGKNITLDLNGKNLIEAVNGGICVDSNSTLTVTGEGSSTRTGDLNNKEYSYVFNVRGGTLVFRNLEFGGTFNGIRVGSGTLTSPRELEDAIKIGTLEIGDANAKISFKAASFDKIVFSGNSGSVKLGDLLQENGCNAFQNEDGKFLLYNTVIDKNYPVENVKTAGCLHDSVTSGTCGYCGMKNLVAIYITDSGTIGTLNPAAEWTEDAINEAANNAFGTWNNMGGTLKLFANFALEDRTITNKYANAIDLNGCKITGGTLTLADGVNVTITDNREGKNGSFAGVTVNGGATLTVDGVSVGKITAADKTANITLKAGSSFTGYALPAGMMLTDWLPADCCVLDTDNNVIDAFATSGTGNFVVKKIPASITAANKTGSILYGGTVPENLRPEVKMNEGETVPQLTYEWRCKTADGFQTLPSTTPNASEILDAFCVITAKDSSGKTLWATTVTGYRLTVTKGQAVVTKAPTANALTYNHAVQNLVTEGTAIGGTMQYSLNKASWFETIPTGTEADDYTVYYKVVGDANHEDTEPQQIKVTIAPKTVDNPTIEVASGSVYNGAPQTPSVTVKDGGDTIDSSEYTVSYSGNTNAGENTATVTITDKDGGNYIVSGSAKFSIAKAQAPKLNNVTHSQKYTVKGKQSFALPDLTTLGMPADTAVNNFRISDGGSQLVSSYGSSDAPGRITYELVESAKLNDQITFMVTVVSTNYEDATLTVIVTLTDRDTPAVTANAIAATYTGSPISAEKITGTAMFGGKTVEGAWSWTENQSLTNVSDSGEKTAVFKPTDEINYKPVETKVQLTINPAALTDVAVQQTGELTYNGQPQTADVTASATAVNNQTVAFTYSATENGTYSETVPAFTEAGEHTVYFKAGASNHGDATGSFKVSIAKADPICDAPSDLTAIYGQKLSEITLLNPSGNTPGEWTWADGTQSVGNVGQKTFKATFTPDDTDNFNVKSEIDVTVTVNKAASAVSAAPTANALTYNGGEQALVNAGTTDDGTMMYSLFENGAYSADVPIGMNADKYTVWYKVAGDSNHNDSAAESVEVTIAKAQAIVTAKDKTAYVNSTVPDLSKPEQDKDYTVSGLIGEDKLTTAPVLKYVDADGKEIAPDMTKTGETIIRASGAENSNYVFTYVDGKLTVTTRPSSGGGSASTPTKTETTTNPDGSTTKTETKADGTVTSTTTNKDGSTTKTETKKDGSSTTEVKKTNGSTGTVSTDKNGQTSASATISEKAVADAKQSDEAVKVPAEVKAGESSTSAPTVKIDLPKNAGATKVEIPVKDVTSGTVAIIVKPDGTEEIVKNSIPTENGLELTVDGAVTVKIVDNAKDFEDAKGHWAQDAIDFVSARGMVNGTSGSTFSPEAPTTRAQLWTMLARQADADTTGGATWYEKAQTWAKNASVSDGSNPDGTITREQLVTMLYRYTGSPAADGSLNSFSDAASVSDYAVTAMQWAVSHGIINGSNGSLNPQNNATRAEVAAILMRFSANNAK